MSAQIFTPINQVRLTNVSVVRLKKGGKRFEIACYKNKVMEWRNNVETDLDNVLQVRSVFTNVSKGQAASKEDLQAAFKTTDDDKIILEILKKGELQVGEKERSQQLGNLSRDIATTVAEKCINPDTKRPYTVTMIEKAMADLHYSVHPNRNAKQQALDVIKQLQEKKTIPIARAQMRVRIVTPGKEGKKVKEQFGAMVQSTEDEDWGEEYELICLIDPGHFRTMTDIVQNQTKGRGQIEVLSIRDTNDKDEGFE
ncbi:hypothetical protein HDU86_002782 [Geranomyces michiganensis]|nr:hypothetical protein HDU86_002782 [Geranomyces michiganensis]